ncbi:unnamed protein product [Lathyrus sativus]|nr:unnamed protein product [Lathyrus sativus]
MFGWTQNVLCACSSKNNINMVDDININEFGPDPLDAVQANVVKQTLSKFGIGYKALFVGVFDGENGSFASEYLNDNLLRTLLSDVNKNDCNVSEDIMRKTIEEMEKKLLQK